MAGALIAAGLALVLTFVVVGAWNKYWSSK